MVGYNEIGSGVPSEQLALLKSRNFSIRPLSNAGHLDGWRVLSLSWLPILIYVFTVLLLTAADFRYSSEQVVAVLYYAGLFVLFVFPVFSVGLLVVGIIATAVGSRVRASAVVYWTWWPFWRFALCVVAAVVGSVVGNTLWYHMFFPHTRMQKLQAYTDVVPDPVSGTRLLDAGIVSFNTSVGVDRSRSGCIKNGATYCVAPIILGGAVNRSDVGDTQDLFMSGVDCCGCPGEFRCGDWNLPEPIGGFRVIDSAHRDFFKLAAQDWASTYGQVLGERAIFFQWVSDPLHAFHDLQERGTRLLVLALLTVPVAIILAVVMLNGILKLLLRVGWAAPIETLLPPPGLGRALSAQFLPHMHQHYLEEQASVSGWSEANPKYVIL